MFLKSGGLPEHVRSLHFLGRKSSFVPKSGDPNTFTLERPTTMDEAVEISLSPDDIVEAIALQQKGLQRLQPLSDSATSYFSLCPSSNGHYGPAEISVSPINGGPRNVFYLPGSRYALCCNDASEDLFRSQYQAVYDTRIRPSQWTLERFDKRCPRLPLPANKKSASRLLFNTMLLLPAK